MCSINCHSNFNLKITKILLNRKLSNLQLIVDLNSHNVSEIFQKLNFFALLLQTLPSLRY